MTLTLDLHKTQRAVRPGPAAGMIWVDGSLYSSALPEKLRALEPWLVDWLVGWWCARGDLNPHVLADTGT